MRPELVREFIAEYHRELIRLNATVEFDRNRQTEELVQTEREIRSIIEAIKSGIRTPSMQAELLALEARKAQLAAARKETQPALVRLRPGLAEIYRNKVAKLDEELNREAVRTEATEILRGLIQEIRLVPEDGQLEIELVGDLAGILALVNENPRLAAKTGAKITLVEEAVSRKPVSA